MLRREVQGAVIKVEADFQIRQGGPYGLRRLLRSQSSYVLAQNIGVFPYGRALAGIGAERHIACRQRGQQSAGNTQGNQRPMTAAILQPGSPGSFLSSGFVDGIFH